MQTQMGDRGIAVPMFRHARPRRGSVVNPSPRLLCAQERDSVPVVQETGWVSKPVWMGPENVPSTGFRTLDSPARSESLYRLECPGRLNVCVFCIYVSLLEGRKGWFFFVFVNKTSFMQFFRYLLYPSQLYMYRMLRPSILRSTVMYRREGTVYVRM